MAVNLCPVLNWQQSDANSVILANGTIETYLAGSSTPATTYSDAAGLVPQSNPIVLNVRGEPANLIYLTAGLLYKFIRKDGSGNVIGQPLDYIRGINDVTATSDQFVAFGGAATYISATSFSLVGDQTSTFEVGRALKLLTSGGTVYAKILSSAYTTLTTVTIQQASGVLDTGLTGTSPSYGIITNSNNSLPSSIDTRVQNQSATSFTTTGTSTAFVGTPSPAITALADKQLWNVEFNVTAGIAPTLAVNGTIAKAIKKYNSAGALDNVGADDIVANMISLVEYSLSDDCYILLNPLPVVIPISYAQGTANTTTGGTSFDFTGLPANVKNLKVKFAGVSLSLTADLLVQLIVGGTPVTTGYNSTSVRTSNASTTTGTNATNGFNISSGAGGNVISGGMEISNLTGNVWVATHGGKLSTTVIVGGGGDIALAGAITGVRVTTSNGTDTFDANNTNISYEFIP